MDVARPLYAFGLVSSFLLVAACGPVGKDSPDQKVDKASETCAGAVVPNKFIVRWKDGSTTVEKAADRETLIRDVIAPHNEAIESAEHDFKVSIPQAPSDMRAQAAPSTPANTMWGPANVKADQAWATANGSGIVVAVIDSGTDISHAQLRNQIAVNTVELNGRAGVDDDANGFIDDVYGYDFSSESPNMQDGVSGHGTHVAGIIAAEHVVGKPQGIAPGAKILPLRFIGDDGGGAVSDAIRAIDYAVGRGAKVINASWGGEYCSKSLRTKIGELEAKGVLFIAAAGNGDRNGIGLNLDEIPAYPAVFEFVSQLTVGAINSQNRMTGFSNYSRKYVHILAPGAAILSTYPAGNDHDGCLFGNSEPVGYCTMNGTSMATPFVSGAAAVVWSHRPKATLAQVRSALVGSVDVADYPVSSGGKLNLKRALDQIAVMVGM